MMAQPQIVFWPGSLEARGFTTILRAAKAGRFTAAAVSPHTLHGLLKSGQDGASILAEAAEHGVRLTHLDGATSWAPIWCSEKMNPFLRRRFSYSPAQILDLAETAGVTTILAAGAFDPGAVPLDDLVAGFAAFCDTAAAREMRVELEFVPPWGVPDLNSAWQIVRQANRLNGTLMIDTWHLLKGSADPAAGLAVLETIPGGKLTGLQLADALISPQAATPWDEGRFRRFPGDGELDLARIVLLLLRKGGLRSAGAEVFGQAIDDLDPDQAGVRAAASTLRILDGARASLSLSSADREDAPLQSTVRRPAMRQSSAPYAACMRPRS
jgi:sugar phosphate isomerase/epimerase